MCRSPCFLGYRKHKLLSPILSMNGSTAKKRFYTQSAACCRLPSADSLACCCLLSKRIVECAPQLQIVVFEDIAIDFFPDILGMDYLGGIWISDESALRDFAGCGAECDDYPVELREFSLRRPEQVKLWRRWVTQKIFARYGVEVPEDARILLVDLFRQIKTARPIKIQ